MLYILGLFSIGVFAITSVIATQNKKQVADLFAEKIPGFKRTNDVDALINEGRRVLRDKFKKADVGITGVNFAVAETGTLCLVENEGNGQMCTTVPDMHIAITGIEIYLCSLGFSNGGRFRNGLFPYY